MEKLINELKELMKLEKTPANAKKFNKTFMKAAQVYATYHNKDLADGLMYVREQIR